MTQRRVSQGAAMCPVKTEETEWWLDEELIVATLMAPVWQNIGVDAKLHP